MSGFVKTPPSDLAIERTKQKAFKTLHIDPDAELTVSPEDIARRFQELAKMAHPDIALQAGRQQGKSEARKHIASLQDLRDAKDFLIKYVRNKDD